MQKIPKIFFVLGIVAAILVIGGLIGWLAGSGSKTPQPSPISQGTADAHSTNPGPTGHSPASVVGSNPVKNSNTDGEVFRVPTFPPDILTNWEDKVDEILGAETDDTNKVEQLFALFPHVPAESRAEVAQHLSNLVGDDAYAPLGELLKDPTLGDDALDVLMQDVLGRPNSLKLPELLAVAQTPSHPKADEAKDFLSLFLEEDYGDDWGRWRDKM